MARWSTPPVNAGKGQWERSDKAGDLIEETTQFSAKSAEIRVASEHLAEEVR